MRTRKCVCGKNITLRYQLCNECLEIYGDEKSEWPEWLRWAVADLQREINYARRHDELFFDEETPPYSHFVADEWVWNWM